MTEDIFTDATSLLQQLTGHDVFHLDQFETIEELVANRGKVFLVERTGWGKSAVYFIATSMLRDRGLGPTLVISPLLALMRNQLDHAGRLGLNAESINSTNSADWERVTDRLTADDIDLLLIAPERFANQQFQEEVLAPFGGRSGLIVVDEAHCISDWGHDFRPDYRRIKNLLNFLPRNSPIVACTATANDRVVEDVLEQLGRDVILKRGPLTRDGLSLAALDLQSQAHRLAWLAEHLPQLTGTGIVYCLTKRDVEHVSAWLNSKGIEALPYHGGLANEEREETERRLLANECKVVVATKALGMGFDKPDLHFVIHFQMPGSVIEYYQQVGRAGRQLDTSIGILFTGVEDADIHNYFIDTAFASQSEIDLVLRALEASDTSMRLMDLEGVVNLQRRRLLNLLKNLEVDGYIFSDGFYGPWRRSAQPYVSNSDHHEAISRQRLLEWEQMQNYATGEIECRMKFLQMALDDPTPQLCGICDLCNGAAQENQFQFNQSYDQRMAREASEFLRSQPIEIQPRKQWVLRDERAEVGLALCRWGDGGWGDDVRSGKQHDHHFSEELVEALVSKFVEWHQGDFPDWVTCVPSLNSPELVTSFASRVAQRLQIPFVEAVRKVRDNAPQKTRENTQQQRKNVYKAFEMVEGSWREGSVLLVDDIVDSRWTLTEIAVLLRREGSSQVIPLVLADSSSQ